MFAKDILLDLAEALGTCIDERAYRRLTDAVRLLTRKHVIDQVTGEIAVCVCGNFVTLPPEVRTILGVQVNSAPAIIRNEWFSYHVNGPGNLDYTPFNYADVLGTQFCTIRDPDRAVRLVTRLHAASDANKKLRVFGWAENGDRIYSAGPSGAKQDGFYVPMIWQSASPASGIPAIAKIDRISKDMTDDFVDLYAVDPANLTTTLSKLGMFRPEETTPAYTRIRVPQRQVVSVKFRRRDAEIRSSMDWINTDNREALLLAVRAVKSRLAGQLDLGAAYESEAVRLIKSDDASNQPGGISPPQVIVTGATACDLGTEGIYY